MAPMSAGPITAIAIDTYSGGNPPKTSLRETHFSEVTSATVTEGYNSATAIAQVFGWEVSASAFANTASRPENAALAAARATFSDRLLITGGEEGGVLSFIFEVRPNVSPYSYDGHAVFCGFDQCSGYWMMPSPALGLIGSLPGPVDYLLPELSNANRLRWIVVERPFHTGVPLDVQYIAAAGAYSAPGSALLSARLVGVRFGNSACPMCEYFIESESGLNYNALTAIPEPGSALITAWALIFLTLFREQLLSFRRKRTGSRDRGRLMKGASGNPARHPKARAT